VQHALIGHPPRHVRLRRGVADKERHPTRRVETRDRFDLGLRFDELRHEWGAHGWATIFIPFKNGSGVEATIDVVNKLYLIRDPYHFSDWGADGDANHLQSYYQLVSYSPSNPFTVTESITNDTMVTYGAVNYFHG